MRRSVLTLLFMSLLTAASARLGSDSDINLIKRIIANAKVQLGNELKVIDRSGKILNPVTLTKDGKVFYCNYEDWRSGLATTSGPARQMLSPNPSSRRSTSQVITTWVLSSTAVSAIAYD